MKRHGDRLVLSASDLSAHLGCHHLTQLSVDVAHQRRKRPHYDDPTLDLLREKGKEHEKAYLECLRGDGKRIKEFPDQGATTQEAVEAMRQGFDVIFQATLDQERWSGRADFLLKTDGASDLGDYHYEVVDTKLARETRAGTVLQLCLYADLLDEMQGRRPDRVMVVSPGKDFEPEVFRVDHYWAYYQLVKRRLGEAVEAGPTTYPEPCAQCDICNWFQVCADKRRQDDHLSLVAGITRMQRTELADWGIDTLTGLGQAKLPKDRRPKRGTRAGLEKAQDQARVQLQGRNGKHPYHELQDIVEGEGLARLPAPDAGDVFFDIEGDAFAGNAFSGEEGAGGLEYLFGWVDVQGNYEAQWAYDGADEKRVFEAFVDDMTARREAHPGMHIYHYAPYEPGALKRLMGRYATREQEVDDLLRHGVFVDLYGVVRQGVRCSVESYSIKRLEEFYGFEREQGLPELGRQKRHFEAMLQGGEGAEAPQEMRDTVQLYNKDDCVSTLALREWLERLRDEHAANGNDVPRPQPPVVELSEERNEKQAQIEAMRARLLADVPVVRAERSPEAEAKWLLAHMLDWHWREDKVTYWEKFRLIELLDEDYLDERSAIAGLEFVEDLPKGKPKERVKRVRYRYPTQEVRMAEEDELYDGQGKSFGTVIGLDMEHRTVDVKKRQAAANHHPPGVFTWKMIPQKEQPRSLMELAEFVAEHGVDGTGDGAADDGPDDTPGMARAGRDLLLRKPPRLTAGASLRQQDEDSIAQACRLAMQLDGGMLPIQGPPGSGKTYTAAHMIVALVAAGKRVGVTAQSHKVIDNLLLEAVAAGTKQGVKLQCVHKGTTVEHNPAIIDTDNDGGLEALQEGAAQVVGGTAWVWARAQYKNAVDVLFVDEAGQMSLANVLAVSPCTKSLVLLGDPQQLPQTQKGSHPDGTEKSGLEHVLQGAETIDETQGLFLHKTWRLHPSICDYTSRSFYEGKLGWVDGLEIQVIEGPTRFVGAGLFVEPVEHDGNQNASAEEVQRVVEIVDELLQPGVTWTDRQGDTHQLTEQDILVVAPYNAQVADLQAALGERARVGTVDKFQGQEAPVVIYSMTTSSPEDAPRGMEFLYSLNRLNVATSRARCVCVLVAEPRLFEPECRSVRQMRLANGVCGVLGEKEVGLRADGTSSAVKQSR